METVRYIVEAGQHTAWFGPEGDDAENYAMSIRHAAKLTRRGIAGVRVAIEVTCGTVTDRAYIA